MVITFNSNAQIINKYKSTLPKEFLEKSLIKENSIVDKNSLAAAHTYLELGRNSLIHNEELALEYELKAKAIFTVFKNDTMIAKTNLSMTFPYINKGRYEEADAVIEEVFEIAKKIKDEKLMMSAYLRLGYKEGSSGNNDKSLAAYLKAYNYHIKYKKIHDLGDLINRIGSTYKEIGDCNSAMKYWLSYINEVEKNKAEGTALISMKANMIECFIEFNDLDKAKQLSLEVIASRKKSKSNKLMSDVYKRLAKVYVMDNKLNLALNYLDTAYRFANLFDNEKLKSKILIDRGEILDKLNEKEEAISTLNRALTFALKGNATGSQMLIYRKLSTIHFMEGNLKLAYFFDQKSDSIYQKLYSTDVITSIKKLEQEILEKNSQEKIDLLENQNKLKNEVLSNQKKINYFIIILLFLALISLACLYYYLKLRDKSNKELQDKNSTIEKALNENKILVKEIHHRVKNNLQIVASLLGLQSRYSQDKMVQEAVTLGKTRVQAMSLLHQNLYGNENLHSVPIKKYFDDLCSNLTDTLHLIEKNISLSNDIDDLTLDLDQVVTLGLIVNELITNAIKHAFNNHNEGEIELTIKKENDYLVTKISDNGIGIPFTTIPTRPTSMGYQLIASFIDKLDAKVSIDNTYGTIITIIFKPQENQNEN